MILSDKSVRICHFIFISILVNNLESQELFLILCHKINNMTSKNSKYAKTFGLFLLLSIVGGSVVSLVNRYLRSNDMASQTSTYILWIFLMVYFFFVCRWTFRKLNDIGKDK